MQRSLKTHAVQKHQREAIIAELCRTFREARIAQGKSMTQVAEESGLSQQAVSYFERSLRSPSVDTLLRIAASLDLDLSKVFRNTGKAVRTKKKQ